MMNNEIIMFQNIIINNYVQRAAILSHLKSKSTRIKIHRSFMILKPVFFLKKSNNNLSDKNIFARNAIYLKNSFAH